MEPEAPIGIFDSGVGGLTVAKAILKGLPQEGIIYFADTAHLPYGPRPLQEIKTFALRITQFLVDQGCKAIVMGCNMSSGVALGEAKEKYHLPIIGVIEAGVRAALRAHKKGKIGVLGTEGTVKAQFYSKEFNKIRPDLEIIERSCPKFVPLIEAGKINGLPMRKLAKEYLKDLKDIDTLVLGCTHYPFVRNLLQEIVGPKVKVIDPAEEIASELKNELTGRNLCRNNPEAPKHKFYASGKADKFIQLGSQFLGCKIPAVIQVKL